LDALETDIAFRKKILAEAPAGGFDTSTISDAETFLRDAIKGNDVNLATCDILEGKERLPEFTTSIIQVMYSKNRSQNLIF
jgi:hypothetical protein